MAGMGQMERRWEEGELVVSMIAAVGDGLHAAPVRSHAKREQSRLQGALFAVLSRGVKTAAGHPVI